MAYNQLSSLATLGNSGRTGATENLGYFAKLLWCKPDFEISSEANALLEATWQDAINLKQVYPFPMFSKVENSDEDDVKESFPTGQEVFVREGKIRETGHVNLALMALQNLRTFNNVQGKLALVTSNGYIVMYSPDGTKAKGFSLQNFHVGGIGKTDGSNQRMTPISWGLADPTEVLDYGVAIKPSWNPLELEGLLDVVITLTSSATASLCQFTVTRQCDGEGVDGLVQADFSFLKNAGTAQDGAGLAFVEIGQGEYKFTATASLVDGTINLKDPDLQTTGGYESTGSAIFNVP